MRNSATSLKVPYQMACSPLLFLRVCKDNGFKMYYVHASRKRSRKSNVPLLVGSPGHPVIVPCSIQRRCSIGFLLN